MSPVRDYNLVIDQRVEHPVFDALFDDQPRVFPAHAFNLNRPDDWYHVISADPAQTRAILQSRAGYSYIIQGPPGTGKSQTITNLIADFVARGKNILFVCKKEGGAGCGVYHRLKQVGLEELCCYIHDSQGDKKEFIRNLKGTYEEFIRNKMDLAMLRTRRQGLVDRMNVQLDLLREFHEVSQAEDKEAGIGTRALIERLIELRAELVPLSPVEEEWLPSYREWRQAGPVPGELEAMLEETGAEPVFAVHPFSRLREALFTSAMPHRDLAEALKEALGVLAEVEQLLQGCRLEAAQVLIRTGSATCPVRGVVVSAGPGRTGSLALADPTRRRPKSSAVICRNTEGYSKPGSRRRRKIHWRTS